MKKSIVMEKSSRPSSIADPAVYFDPNEWRYVQRIQMKILSPNSPKKAQETLDIGCPPENYYRRKQNMEILNDFFSVKKAMKV